MGINQSNRSAMVSIATHNFFTKYPIRTATISMRTAPAIKIPIVSEFWRAGASVVISLLSIHLKV